MKYAIIILFCLFSVVLNAQQRFPTGFPTQFNTGFNKWGYAMSDSGLIVANRDTNWLAKYSGTIVFRPANKKFYYFDSTTLMWNQFGTVIDTTSLSNRINLKLNISDTASMLSPYLRKVDTTNIWVTSVFRKTASDSVFYVKGGSNVFAFKDSIGGGGSGTVTSVALSMPSAFTVSGSPITTSGTFNVSGAGTSLEYIRGNGTLATFDTTAIPNFYIKARSLLSGTSPITYNSTTGAIGINNATASGTKGAATFVNSSFSDNGLGTIDLLSVTSAGTCINCDITFDAKGRAVSYASGTPPNFVNAPGAGDTLSFLDTLKRLNPGFGITHTVTNYNITQKVDTSVIATQYDLTLLNPGIPLNSIQFNNAGLFGGDSLQYYPTDNKILTSQDYFQYGRPITGFFQSSNPTNSTGRLWTVYPRHSSGSGADTLQPFFSEMNTTLYDVAESENPVFTLLQFGSFGSSKPLASIRLEQNYYDLTEYHALTTKPRLMDPNGEIRHWSWTISQINGTAEMATRSTSNIWKYSALGTDYDKQYATLNSTSFGLSSITNIGSVGANAGYLGQWGIVMQIDTTSSGQAQLATSAITNELQIGPLAMSITNPNASGGTISLNKFTQTVGKEFRAANIPNSTVGLSVTTSAVGFIYSVSADASGFADTRNTGTFLINRDVLQSASTRMLGIYNNSNADDSLFHVRGNGNLWTKGLVNIKTLKTTLTAPATEGTTKMVICDTNGLLSFVNIPSDSGIWKNNVTMDGDHTMSAGTNTWTISGSAAFADGAQFDVTTSGSVGIAIRGQSTDGRGVMGLATTGVGVYGSATGAAGYGLFGISSGSGGNAIYGSSTSGMVLEGVMNPTSTNTVIPAINLTRSSQSVGANGIGQSIDFYNHTSTSDALANQIISKWTDATNATRTSQFSIVGVNSASTQTIATFDGDGTYTTIGRRIIAVTTSSAGTLTLGNSHSYVFTGTTTTWTLPAVSGTTGVIYYLKNRGSGSITLNANAAANEIYSTSAVNTYEITAGSAIILISDGTYWTVN